MSDLFYEAKLNDFLLTNCNPKVHTKSTIEIPASRCLRRRFRECCSVGVLLLLPEQALTTWTNRLQLGHTAPDFQAESTQVQFRN